MQCQCALMETMHDYCPALTTPWWRSTAQLEPSSCTSSPPNLSCILFHYLTSWVNRPWFQLEITAPFPELEHARPHGRVLSAGRVRPSGRAGFGQPPAQQLVGHDLACRLSGGGPLKNEQKTIGVCILCSIIALMYSPSLFT